MVVLSCKTLDEIICIKTPDTSFFGLFYGHRMICCNILCFFWKTSTWSKGNKDGNPSPHKCCLIIVLGSLGRKFLVWLCKETSIYNQHGWALIKYLNVLHLNRTQKQLLHSLQKYYQLPILGTLEISGHFHQKQ